MLAFLLRRYHLGNESLWFDEADLVRRAGQPLGTLLANFAQAGENGPLYTLLLHFWLSAINAVPALAKVLHLIFGQDDEALARAISALFGAGGIPLIYALAKRLGGWRIGIAAAGLLTFNPFHIWYSQDAKMYTMLVFLSLASSVLYLDALKTGGIRQWAGYVVVTWVMLTVHSMAVLVLLAQLVGTWWVGIGDREAGTGEIGPSRKVRWVRWGWAMLLIFAPLFPIGWLRLAAVVTGTADVGGWYSATGLADIMSTIFVAFAVNRAPAPWETIGAVVMGLLALLGTGYFGFWTLGFRFGKIEDGRDDKSEVPKFKILLLALWLVPIVAFWVVTLKIPLFQPRYLIMSLPPYLIFAAAGLLWLRRLRPEAMFVGLLALALPTSMALASVNYSPQVQKEDWRGAMAYVQDHLRGRDVVVVFPGYMVTAVDYYYKPGGLGAVPQVDIKTIPSLKTQGFGETQLNAMLRDVVSCHERAWLITSPPRQAQEDPNGLVQEWFQYNWHTFDTRVFNGVTVYGVAFNGQPNCWYPGPDHKERYSFENGLEFLGYIYELRQDSTEQPDASYFPLTMYWRSSAAIQDKYDVRLRISDPSGKVVVDEALGPLNGYWPTDQWPPGIQVIDYRDLRLPGGLTPGNYTVSLQLYPEGHPDQPLKLKDGGTVITFKGPLKVVPWKATP